MTDRSFGVSLGVKIFSIVISILLFIVGVAVIAYLKISDVKDEIVDLDKYIIPITNAVSLIDVHVLEQEVYMERLFRIAESKEKDQDHFDEQLNKFEEKGHRIDEEISKAIELILLAEKNAILQEDKRIFKKFEPQLVSIEKQHQEFHDHAINILNELQSGHLKQAHHLEAEIEAEETHFDEEINNIYHSLERYAERAGHKATAHQNSILRLNIILTLSAILLAFILAYIFTRGLIKPIDRLISAMRTAGKGDYSVRVEVNSRDEIRSLADSFEKMVEELALKEKIKTTFGKYVDPRIVENLIDQNSMQTGGEKKEMTVMFSQFDQFEQSLEKLDADTQINATNQYLSIMSKAIGDNFGVLDKYIDTIVMAFWGSPFTSESDHSILACKAALLQKSIKAQIGEILHQMNAPFDEQKLVLRCGISSGSLVVGNMGSEQSKSYTVLGDTVNIASRLKGAASQYQVPILISKDTLQLTLQAVVSREIDLIQVMGKEEPVTIFEPLYLSENFNPKLEKLKQFYEEGLRLYRERQWDKSDDSFSECLKLIPDDGPSLVIKERIRNFQNNPPKTDWDGVWQLKKK